MLGERLYKNYRVPWEDKILATAKIHPSAAIRILDPHFEALLLVVRCSIELNWIDPVTVIHWRRTATKFAMDRDYLARIIKVETLWSLAEELVGADLAEPVVNWILGKTPFEGARRLRPAIKRHFALWRTSNVSGTAITRR
jgi:hypothetical protein